ncbi:MAG: hypothetical protein HDS69_05990 [Bacteroidales bacterium]|nr:hypothetical protein [Bacteroidales bacterium]
MRILTKAMTWNNNTKEILTYIIAGVSLLFGFGLTIAGFIVDPTGIVSESVLWILAQVFVFSGALMGINLSINQAKNKVKNELADEIKKHLDSNKGCNSEDSINSTTT